MGRPAESFPSGSPQGRPVRCGVDVVSIDRIGSLLEEFGESFKRRVYAPAERRYCEGRGDPPQHYAARWAAKEAFLKAVCADTPAVPFREVVVGKDGDRPRLAPEGAARAALDATAGDGAGVEHAVSLSHDRDADRAIGQVVLQVIPG